MLQRLRPSTRLTAFLFTLLLVQAVLGLGGTLLVLKSMLGVPLDDTAAIEEALAAHEWLLVRVLWIPLNLAGVALVWFFQRRVEGGNLADLGLGRPRVGALATGLGAGAVLGAAAGLPALAGAGQGPAAVASPGLALAVVFFLSNAIAAELTMRGYVLHRLLENGRVVRAVLGSAVVFALFQRVNPETAWGIALLNLVLLGIFLGLARLWTGTLWLGVAFHVGWNAMLGPVLGLPVAGLPFAGLSGRSHVPAGRWGDVHGGSFGPEGGVVMTIVLAAAALALASLLSRRESAVFDEEA